MAAAQRGERSLVYAYERELDHTGHVEGCGSPEWLTHLSRIDRWSSGSGTSCPTTWC